MKEGRGHERGGGYEEGVMKEVGGHEGHKRGGGYEDGVTKEGRGHERGGTWA